MAINTLHLRVLVLFLEDILRQKGITLTQASKDANFNRLLYYNAKRIIAGKNAFKITVNLIFIIYLSNFFGVTFDMAAYLKVIAEQDRLKLLSEVSGDDLPT